MPRRRRRRGYPVALLVGIQDREAAVWNVYSESIRQGPRISENDDYRFHEAIVDALRPSVKQGVGGIVIASQDEKDYKRLMGHIEKHHSWLTRGWRLNTASFEFLQMNALTLEQVRSLVRAPSFMKRLSSASEGGVSRVMDVLEERLNDPDGIETLLFTLKEIEETVYREEGKAEYILLTDQFQERHKGKTQRLLQVAGNKGIKTRIILADTVAGARVSQFGGLVCITKNTRLESIR